MDYKEFRVLLAALGPDTPLGQIVQIRCENDKEILKNFTPKQHEIRTSWRRKIAEEETKSFDEEEYMKSMNTIKEAFAKLASS